MTLEQKIGQFFFPAAFINDSEEEIQTIEKLIRDHNIGGLTFFHSRASAATNYESKKKVILNDESCQRLKELIIRYQQCAPTPLLISIDAEWGLAMRVEKTPQYPYAITLGALPETQIKLVYQVGKQIGLDLKSVGVNYNLAPLADINNNPNNPVIGFRSFGESKKKVADFAIAYLQGTNDAGVLGCLKHFPGHGNTNVDSHLGLPVLTETLEELSDNELFPFIAGIRAGVDSIMIGHLAVPALNEGKNTSATLSKNIIEVLLRKQLGYDGLIISDALNMHSVSKLYDKKGQLEWEAFNAGNDVLCFAENVHEGILEILKNASAERIEASYERIMKCKHKVGLFDSKASLPDLNPTQFDWQTVSQLNSEIAQNCLTTIKDNENTATILAAQKAGRLAKISIYQEGTNEFFSTLGSNFASPTFACTTTNQSICESWNDTLQDFDTILLALYIPKAKPQNNFEIEDKVLTFISNFLISKKCIVYVFGNPYALQVIPNLNNAIGLIAMYQDFAVFQNVAALQLSENKSGKGKLPVQVTLC